MSTHMLANEPTSPFDWRSKCEKPAAKKKTYKRKPQREMVNAFLTSPMSGLSERAQRELMVPANRIGVILPGSGDPSRIPAIPNAYRGK